MTAADFTCALLNSAILDENVASTLEGTPYLAPHEIAGLVAVLRRSASENRRMAARVLAPARVKPSPE